MALFTTLAIASGVSSAASGILGAKATNSAARRTWRNALKDRAFQYRQAQRQFIEQDRSARQAGYDAALQARAARASAVNSGASGGISGNTVDALIAEQMRVGARNQSRIQDQRTNNRAAFSARTEKIQSQTQSRINQTPTDSFGFLDAASIAANTALSIAGQNMNMPDKGTLPAGTDSSRTPIGGFG